MKIALLSEKYTPDLGGLAISTGRLGEMLASAGHDVRVFAPTLSLPPTINQSQRSGGVHSTRFGARKRVDDTLVDWFELIVEEHQREPFDLIQAYFLPMAGFVGAYAGKYLEIPSVVSIRGNDIERAAFDPGKFSQILYALQNASAVTTNATVLAMKAKAFLDREIHIIPNGIDTERFKPVKKNEVLAEMLSVKRATSLIGFVGELREKKGLATLLSGYAQIAKELPATLLLIGEIREGEDRKYFEEFRSSNPNSRMIVTGHIPHKDLPAYYALMDIFVHPSLRDGMPNAVLEAMACEVPVIATPVGGIPDVIKDGTNGRIIPVNDAGALAKVSVELLNDKDQRNRLGKEGRKTVQSAFTPEKELEANLRLYNELSGK